MAIKLSGMISGMDTDAMIDELVKAYSARKDSTVKAQKSLEYKQDAWKDMNSKIYSLFSGKLSNLRFSSNYAIKSVKASNENKVTVSGSSKAVNGTQELQITSLAKSGYLTGGVVSGEDGAKIKGDSKLSELGITSGSLTLTSGGKSTSIDVTDDMTVSQLVAKFKDAGVNANFDETNQRFFISAKNSGVENDFSLSGDNTAGTEVLKKLGLYTVSSADISAYEDFIAAAGTKDSEYIQNLAKNDYLNQLINEHISSLNEKKTAQSNIVKENNAKIKEEEAKKTFAALSDEDKDKKITELNDKITALEEKIAGETDQATIDGLNEELADLQAEVTLYEEIKAEVGSSEAEDFKDKLNAYNAKIDEAIAPYKEANEAANAEIESLNEQITAAKGMLKGTIADKESYLTDKATVDYTSADYTAYVTEYNEKFDYANEMVAAYEEYQSLVEAGSTDTDRINALKEQLGMAQDETGAVRIEGADAEIYLNGAKFTSNTNNFQINGLTITTHALTDDNETISVTTATDVDGIYNMIKDFFTEYNEVLKAMETGYNAASAGDYEPLTDEEQEALTDKQIEKWETKVKDAVLRKDSTLSSIINLFRTNMMKSFEVDGETLNLSSFGVKTLSYFTAADNEKGAYHIDGNPDDSAVSGNTDKLKAAIASDPDKVINFFSQLTNNLYTQLNKKMGTSTYSSAYKVYNDKTMKQQYEEYEDEIDEWEDKVDAMREKYEKQFAAMETALSKLQSQSSYFSSMLGY